MDTYAVRRNIIAVIIVLIAIVYIGKLFSIQVLDKSYQLSADNNVLRRITQYPARGLIYDRNGNLLVSNQAAYDIKVTPNRLEAFENWYLQKPTPGCRKSYTNFRDFLSSPEPYGNIQIR